MNDELKNQAKKEESRELNIQIQAGIAEKERLQEVVKNLEKEAVASKGRIETELAELDVTLEAKKAEVITIEGEIDTKTTEVNKVEGDLTQVKDWEVVAKESLAEANRELMNTQEETEQAKVSLEKIRSRITLEKEEASIKAKTEEDVATNNVRIKVEELVVLERKISKSEFIKSTADEALKVTNSRNSESEKVEKELRNKISVHRKNTEELIRFKENLIVSIKNIQIDVEFNQTVKIKTESDRVSVEKKLEIAEKKLLSSIESFNRKEEQLNSREEKLKQTYDKAGIEWINLS